MTWYLVQFSADDKKYRLVDSAFEDGYAYGEKALEGAEFKVTLTDNGADFTIEATPETKKLMSELDLVVEEWEDVVARNIRRVSGVDSLKRYGDSEDWDSKDVYLTDSLEYFEDREMVSL